MRRDALRPPPTPPKGFIDSLALPPFGGGRGKERLLAFLGIHVGHKLRPGIQQFLRGDFARHGLLNQRIDFAGKRAAI